MSPRIALRSDIEKFRSALRLGMNWIVTPQGGILMREGFKNFGEIFNPSTPNRIFQFKRGGDLSDIIFDVSPETDGEDIPLVFTDDEEVAFINDELVIFNHSDGFIHFRVDGVELGDVVEHAYTDTQLEALHFTNQENTAVINHPDHSPLYIEIALDGSISGELLPASLIPLADYDDANSPTASTTGAATYSTDWVNGTATTWNPSRNWIMRYDGVFVVGNQGNVKEFEFSSVAATLATRVDDALNLIPALRGDGTTITVVPGIMGTDFSLIDVTIDGEGGGKLLEILPANESADRYVAVDASIDEQDVLEPAWSYPTIVFHGSNYYQCIKPHTPVLVVNEPPVTEFWTDLGTEEPETFDWQYPSGNIWSASAVHYSPGGRGFPTLAVVNQQRMIQMANPGFRMGMFGSRINKYKDFVRGPQDDDPFFFAIDTTDSPTIKWAIAQRSLLIGTSSGDYAVKAGVTLTPSDVQADKQNAARSHNAPAIAVNTDVFYIEQGKEKVRTTAYNRDTVDSQTSTDISLIAEHLLHSRVKRLVLLQTPEVLVIGLRDDGSLVGVAYSPDAGTGAWFEFESQGVFIDIAAAYSIINNEDELWATVTYDGGATHHLEKMPYPKRVFTIAKDVGDDHLVDQGMVLIDGWVTGQIVTGDNNIISGLGQFEGLTVAAMVDDAFAGEYLVTDGAIILDEPPDSDVPNYEGTYAVGLRYTANATTFEVVDGNPKGVGFGTKRRWNKLYVKTIDSALPLINGQLPEDRHPATNMGVAEVIQEGLKEFIVNNLEWGDGSITILQDMPYPTHILGFYGEIEVENA